MPPPDLYVARTGTNPPVVHRLVNGTTDGGQMSNVPSPAAVVEGFPAYPRALMNRAFEYYSTLNVQYYRVLERSFGGNWSFGYGDNGIHQISQSNCLWLHPSTGEKAAIIHRLTSTGYMRLTPANATFGDSGIIQISPSVNRGNPVARGIAINYHESTIFHSLQMSGAAEVDVLSYDYENAIYLEYSFTSRYQSCVDLYVHDNTLFWIGVIDNVGATDEFELRKFSGSNFITATTINDGGGGVAQRANAYNGGGPCLFTDFATGDLIAIIPSQNSGAVVGDQVFRIQDPAGTPTVTDITSTVMSPAYAPGGGSGSDRSQWQVWVDFQTTPGTPAVYLWRLDGPAVAGNWRYFEWNGVGSVMTGNIITSFNSQWSFPHARAEPTMNQPGYFDASARPRIYGPPVEVVGGTQWNLVVTRTGAPIVELDLYIDLKERGLVTRGTLVDGSIAVVSGSPATTPVISGNRISNLTPDNSVVYSFIHDATADGIGSLDRYTIGFIPV